MADFYVGYHSYIILYFYLLFYLSLLWTGNWDCSTCRPKRTLNSKKYGVDLIRYTHAANTAIHSSTKVDGNKIVYICSAINY